MIYLDANISLEILVPGRSKNAEILDLLRKNTEETCISMLTVHIIYYYCRQYKISNELLDIVISRHNIAPLAPEDYEWARKHEIGRDFEDALQVAAAVRMGCTRFITLDRALARNYKRYLPIVLP